VSMAPVKESVVLFQGVYHVVQASGISYALYTVNWCQNLWEFHQSHSSSL